jgi:hypothetical protein
MATTFVHEIEKLSEQFAAAFLLVELEGLEDRPLILDKPIAPGDFAPC